MRTETASPPYGESASNIVGIAVAKSTDRVYTWHRSGHVTIGTSWNLLQRDPNPYPFRLPADQSPDDIVGMASGLPDDRIFTWYRDQTMSIGRSWDLNEFEEHGGQRYLLPGDHTPDDIVGMAITEKGGDNYVYAWYSDGKVSAGTPTDLAAFMAPQPYREPAGATYDDIVGMAAAGSGEDVIYTWYQAAGAETGDLAAVDWCYEIYEPPGAFQPITITFYPIIENRTSEGWSCPKEGEYFSSVEWNYVESSRGILRRHPHWWIGPREKKILTPGITADFGPTIDYRYVGWSFHIDAEGYDLHPENNSLAAMSGAVPGREFRPGGSMVHKQRRDLSLESPYA